MSDVPMRRCPRCGGRKEFECPDCMGTGTVIDIVKLIAERDKYKWQVDLVCHDSEEFDAADLDRRWDELHP